MARKRNRKAVSGRDRVYNLVISLLALTFVILTACFVYALHERSNSYYMEPREILNEISRNNFADAVNYVEKNRMQGIGEGDETYTEAYATVDYYEAAMLYHTCLADNKNDEASVYKSKMRSAYKKMGDMQYKAAEIDALFEKIS